MIEPLAQQAAHRRSGQGHRQYRGPAPGRRPAPSTAGTARTSMAVGPNRSSDQAKFGQHLGCALSRSQSGSSSSTTSGISSACCGAISLRPGRLEPFEHQAARAPRADRRSPARPRPRRQYRCPPPARAPRPADRKLRGFPVRLLRPGRWQGGSWSRFIAAPGIRAASRTAGLRRPLKQRTKRGCGSAAMGSVCQRPWRSGRRLRAAPSRTLKRMAQARR
jgi:hypothetical protein